jgi:glycerophosphoryl diester phosphodiesterase
MRVPWIIAHRGDHSVERENTLAAFEQAIRAGADMIEFDVRALSDGTLVVHHDADLQGQPLNRLTIGELQAANPEIPTLAQTLALCSGRIALDVELKEAGFVDEVLDSLSTARLSPDQFVVTSFDESVVRDARRPGLRTALLVEGVTLEEAIERAQQLGSDYLAPQIDMLGAAALASYSGPPLLPWTVNRTERLQLVLGHARVAGVITDNLALAIQMRG